MRMWKVFAVLVVVSALPACGIQRLINGNPPRPFTTPEGFQGFAISCSTGIDICYQKARESCGGNYKVINQIERQNYEPADKIAGTDAETYTVRTMEVACAT